MFHRNYQCTFLCKKCLASKEPDVAYAYDFSPYAKWKDLLVSHSLYLNATAAALLSPWTRIRSWTIFRNREDLLHNKYLGWG